MTRRAPSGVTGTPRAFGSKGFAPDLRDDLTKGRSLWRPATKRKHPGDQEGATVVYGGCGLQRVAIRWRHNVPENAHSPGYFCLQLNATCFRLRVCGR